MDVTVDPSLEFHLKITFKNHSLVVIVSGLDDAKAQTGCSDTWSCTACTSKYPPAVNMQQVAAQSVPLGPTKFSCSRTTINKPAEKINIQKNCGGRFFLAATNFFLEKYTLSSFTNVTVK